VAAKGAASRLDLFASCAPGLESLLAEELRGLGLPPREIEPGGVAFTGGLDAVCRANLWLRTAGRVIVRIATFRARAFGELERRARAVDWDRVLPPGRAIRLRVTSHKSRLYHTAGIAQRLASAIEAGVPGAIIAASPPNEEEAPRAATDGDPLLVVRVMHDICTVSIDSSGALLHRRGYRLETAKAPMRETLAAAMVLGGGWDARTPLLDPMCGAGTIPIEAALIARRIPPGAHRRFAFLDWPDFPGPIWSRALDQARDAVLPAAPCSIHGSDRDAGAIAAATANAARAGVGADIAFAQRALSAVIPPPNAGWVITNPPYGVRVGDRRLLRDLYAQLGHVLRSRCPGWTLVLMFADARLARHTALDLRPVLSTVNGGIRVTVGRAQLPLQR
jgi:putative N6-adenine-specific DNA methylase